MKDTLGYQSQVSRLLRNGFFSSVLCLQLYQGPNIKYTEGMTVAEKYALEYRRKRAEASVPAVVEVRRKKIS